MKEPTKAKPATESEASEAPHCRCVADEGWHDELVEILGAPPEFIAWGDRLLSAAHQDGEDGEFLRVAGSHQWEDQEAVFSLALAAEELARALARSSGVR